MQISHRKRAQIYDALFITLKWCNYLKLRQKNKIKKKVIYTQDELEVRGFFADAFRIITTKNDKEFRKITRMNVACFTMLFQMLENKITKNSPRKPIEAECRLILTLMCLATGLKYRALAIKFRMGVSTVREIVIETSGVIWDELSSMYIAPITDDKCFKISDEFFNITSLPHCIGALDARHIKIRCPPRGHSENYRYEKSHSVVLLAACDSNYFFTAVDVGAYADDNDDSILQAKSWTHQLVNGKIELPQSNYLPNSNVLLPYFFVTDNTFPLRKNLMRPYPGQMLTADKNEFNIIISTARSKIDDTFGIVATKWRILQDSLKCNPKNAVKIIKGITVLHNFVKTYDSEYCPSDYVDRYEGDRFTRGAWRTEGRALQQCKLFTRFNAPREALQIRDTLTEYMCSYNMYIEEEDRQVVKCE